MHFSPTFQFRLSALARSAFASGAVARVDRRANVAAKAKKQPLI
jgi:hypothetical protein